jgi:hypothetical protein
LKLKEVRAGLKVNLCEVEGGRLYPCENEMPSINPMALIDGVSTNMLLAHDTHSVVLHST